MNIVVLSFLFLVVPAYAGTYTVTNTLDAFPVPPAGSLRQAILDANNDPGSTVVFNIPGATPHTITLTAALEILANDTVVNAQTQPGWSFNNPVIILVSAGSTTFNLTGVTNCVIRGFVMQPGATQIGVFMSNGSGHIIAGNFIGTDQAGMIRIPNRSCITAQNVSDLIIGQIGTINIIAGSGGIEGGIQLSNVIDVEIRNNYIGINKAGTAGLSNNLSGINIVGFSTRITIVENIISGNAGGSTSGINIFADASNILIRGNIIGLNPAGTTAIANDYGVYVEGTPGNVPINFIQIQNNLISANNFGGISLNANISDVFIDDNKIGTDVTGQVALGNTSPDLGGGVIVSGVIDPFGPQTFCNNIDITNNLISGNDSVLSPAAPAIWLLSGVNNSFIDNNIIGLNSTRDAPLPNGIGIRLEGARFVAFDALVTDVFIQNNVISANNQQGILMNGGVEQTTIQKNYIGANTNGDAFGNGSHGIALTGTADLANINSLIGGLDPADANIIAFNGATTTPGYGVLVDGTASNPDILNAILGNPIWHNDDKGIKLENGGNNNQQPPTILKAEATSDTELTITAQAPTAPAGAMFRLEFFINEINRNPITEGQFFIGAIDSVSAGETVTQSFTPTQGFTLEMFVSGTATNLNNVMANANEGDTSEFSLSVPITPVVPPVPPLPPGPRSCISQAIIDKYCTTS